MRRFESVLLAAAASLVLAGCPPPTVVIGGKEMPREQARGESIERARALQREGKTAEAVAAYRDFLEHFPSDAQADTALKSLGDLLLAQDRPAEAAEAFRKLLSDFPQSPHYLPALTQLGLALTRLGRVEEAMQTLEPLWDRLPENERPRVAEFLAQSYRQAGQNVGALLWYSRWFEHMPEGAAREAVREAVLDLIDRRLSFREVREALELLKDRIGQKFPIDLLQLKLGKIFYHIHDFAEARRALETFASAFPNHPQMGVAGKLLKRILDRAAVNRQAIGVVLPLTGQYREYGQKALEGLQLGAGVLDDTPASDGPLLIIRDSGGSPDQAAAQVEDLVFNEHVAAIVGPMFSQEARAAAVKAEELEVPIITLCGREDITGLGQWVFRNFLTLSAQARLLVGYAMDKLSAKRFALLYPNDWYGVAFANAFWDEVSRRQGEVRAAEKYEPDARDFGEPIKKMVGRYYLEARWDFREEWLKVKAEAKTSLARHRAWEKLVKRLSPIVDFDVLFVPDVAETLALVAPAIAYEDIVLWTDSRWQQDRIKKALKRDRLDMVRLLGGDGWNNPKLIEWAERYVQGAIFSDGFFARSARPATALFVGRFKNAFDREPGLVEAEAYDTGRLLRHVMESARPSDRKQFRAGLLSIQGLDLATGTTRFNPDREAEKNLFLLTIRKDEIIELDPSQPPPAGRG